MSPPLEDPTLLWLLRAVFGALGVIFVWIFYHSIRDAKREAKVDELTQEIGHPTIKGSIMERLHRYGSRLRRIWEHLQLSDNDDK